MCVHIYKNIKVKHKDKTYIKVKVLKSGNTRRLLLNCQSCKHNAVPAPFYFKGNIVVCDVIWICKWCSIAAADWSRTSLV